MKNIIAIALFALCLTPAAAFSQAPIYNRPVATQPAPSDSALPAMPGASQQQKAAPAAPAPAVTPAAPETIQDFAKRYYENCMTKKSDVLKVDALQGLCQCSSEHLQKEMTVEQVKTMTTDTPEGLAQRNHMMLKVYAPCMGYPARELIYDNCANDPGVKQKVPNYERVCGCEADGMAKYIADNGPTVMKKSIAANPNDQNPLNTLMNSQEFQGEAKTKLMSCLLAGVAGQ